MKHQFFTIISLSLILCITATILTGCGCKHEWKEATCTSAMCCSLCGGIQGEPIGHTWTDATCAAPKTCSTCGETEGVSLEHTYSDWAVEVEATASISGKKVRRCSSCDKVDSESYSLSSFVKDKKFIFTPQEFRKIFFDNFVDLNYSKFGGAQIEAKDGQVVVAIRDNLYNNVGNVGFVVNSNTWKMASSFTESGFEGVVMIISADTAFVANSMQCLIMSCDPTANANVAKEVAKEVLKEAYEFGGITYSITATKDYYMMTAVAK